MCQSVCSLPRRGSSCVSASRRREGLRDAPKVCVGGYAVWNRAKLSPSALLTFSLPFPFPSPSWLFGLLITTTTWLERRLGNSPEKTKNEEKGREIWMGTNAQTPGGLFCETVDCKTVSFFLKIGFNGVAEESHTLGAREPRRFSLASLALPIFSLAPDLLFDCSRVLE